MIKSCGGCEHWTKWKNDYSGVCDLHDHRAKSDAGGGCKDWTGKKYDRTKQKKLDKQEQRLIEEDG